MPSLEKGNPNGRRDRPFVFPLSGIIYIMENYIERFKRATDPEEIREILIKIREEDIPVEKVIHPRVIANKILELEDVDAISEILEVLNEEEEEELYWDAYIYPEFFIDKIKESDDIGGIGSLLIELLNTGYPDGWIYNAFTLQEILSKIKKDSNFIDVIRYYLGFLAHYHWDLLDYLNKYITSEDVIPFLKKADDLCELSLLLSFMLKLRKKLPEFCFTEEEFKKLIDHSPLRCFTEIIYLSKELDKTWINSLVSYFEKVDTEDEGFSDVLEFFNEIVGIYNRKSRKPEIIFKRFIPLVMEKLKDENIDLLKLSRGIDILKKVFETHEFIDDLFVWKRLSKKYPPYVVANLIISVLNAGYPLEKIPTKMIANYLLYYNMLGDFFYYIEEYFHKIEAYKDKFANFLGEFAEFCGEEKILKSFAPLSIERVSPALGFLRSKTKLIRDLTNHPDFLEDIASKLTQLSELEEIIDILSQEEEELLLSFVNVEKLKDLILSSEGFAEINGFIKMVLRRGDLISIAILEIIFSLTEEDLRLLFSIDDDTTEMIEFLGMIDEFIFEKRELFVKKLPLNLIIKRLISVETLEDIPLALSFLNNFGIDMSKIRGDFFKGLFLRNDIPVYAFWMIYSPEPKRHEREEEGDLFIGEEAFLEDEGGYPESYKNLFLPLLDFYRKLLELNADTTWIKEFTILEIEEIISTTRPEFVASFLEFLYYGRYPKKSIQQINQDMFIKMFVEGANGPFALFMKKRLLSILSLWEYPLDWIKRLNQRDLEKMICNEKTLEDLDILLITLERLGLSKKTIRAFLSSQKFKDRAKNAKFFDMLRMARALLQFEVPIPHELRKGFTEAVKNEEIKGKHLNFFVNSFPIIGNPEYSLFYDDKFLREIIKKDPYNMLYADYYYKNFVRIITYLNKEEYDEVLKREFLIWQPKKEPGTKNNSTNDIDYSFEFPF